MRTLILMLVGAGFLSACSNITAEPDAAVNYVDESENPLDVLVENPIVNGIFYVLEATVLGAERGTNALLERVR